MAQGDYLIQNQSFPSFRSDLNSTLEAINTSNSGTSRPSSAVAGTVWLDTTNATNPTLKFFDGTDDISLAQLDYTTNTVNWLDSTVTISPLTTDLDVGGNAIISSSNGNITFTPDGTGKVIISGLSYPSSDGTSGQFLKTDGAGNLSFDTVTTAGTTLTTQGDILYRDASGLARLGAGTSGQALLTQGAGANPIWGLVGGGVLQAVWNANDTPVNTNSGIYQPTNNSVTITPTANDSKILVILSGQVSVDNSATDPWIFTRPYRDIGGGGYSAISDYRRYAPSTGTIHILEDVHHFFIDAPATTSAVTYKTYFHGAGTSIWFGGRSSSELSRTNAIAIELANGIA